jgi:transposase
LFFELLQDGIGDDPRPVAMARPYSDDLRRKFLEAYDAGSLSLASLAKQFRVSVQFAKKIRGQLLRTGQMERQVQSRFGAKSRVTETAREQLRQWLAEQPDSTDEQLRQRLAGTGVAVSKSRVGQLLREMGSRRKKSRSTPRSGTPNRTSSGARSSSPRSDRSDRKT